ncbi:MAG: response regulator [Chloroflexota bacterium]|nr:MAG: response regulator [Chloroflexota bacterium]
MTFEHETVLLVDDEENILSALRRLFRLDGYTILTATSAEEGLGCLENNRVHLVVSDNMMPGMGGMVFLAVVRERWPDVVRIMLTGRADAKATIAAINRGEVYRFITKPWDSAELRITIKQALEHRRLIEENKRLALLTQDQNIKLMAWNENLLRITEELDVKLRHKTEAFDARERELKEGVLRAVSPLLTLLDQQDAGSCAECRRTAAMAQLILDKMRLGEPVKRC